MKISNITKITATVVCIQITVYDMPKGVYSLKLRSKAGRDTMTGVLFDSVNSLTHKQTIGL